MKIITGMHRSGTSLVARLFYEAGSDLGPPETFFPENKWNPDGYFQQKEILRINQRLLHGPWGRFSYFKLPSDEIIMKRARKRASQIQKAAETYRDKIVKDPIFCLTLSAWIELGTEVDAIVLCLRDPIAVARSLWKRNRASQKHSFGLWLAHNERLLANAREIPLWCIYYHNLLNDQLFVDEMKPAFAFFGIEMPEADLNALQRKCVKAELDHGGDCVFRYPNSIQRCWKDLLARHRRQFKKDRGSTC